MRGGAPLELSSTELPVREMDLDAGLERGAAFLRDLDAVLDGLRLGGVGVWRWNIDSDRLDWTENLEAVHTLPAGSFDGTLSSFQRDIHPDDVETVWHAIRTAIETGSPYRMVYRTAPRDNADPLWIEAAGGVVTGPEGRRHLTGVCLDVTGRVLSERELQRRLAQQKAVERFGSFALGEENFQAVLDRAVETAASVLDVPLTKILQFANAADHLVLRAGIGWGDGMVGRATVGIGQDSQAGYTLTSPEPVVVTDLLAETRFAGPQLLHDYGVRSGMSVTIPGTGERPFGVFGIHATRPRRFDQADVDFLVSITNIVATAVRQHAAAEQRTLLMREMAHRAGNMLQLVSTIANQTFREDADIAAARQSFSERLGSLSRANYLVSQGGWTSTRLVSLLDEALQPFREHLEFTGRDILLPPDLCFDLGLIVHELATNSAKYGTLKLGEGRIAVAWTMSGAIDGHRQFGFVWSDPATAHSSAVPGSGFGSKLLRALIERKWSGAISVDTSAGYRFAFEIPVAT